MTGQEIVSHDDLMKHMSNTERAFVLLYKKGSEQSECALNNLQKSNTDVGELKIYLADVTAVRDIHTRYNITTVPTMLEFEKGRFVNVLKGCHEPGFYKSFFDNAIYAAKMAEKSETQQKKVTVYTTPTCSWCTTLKTHLRKNGVRYTEIDVSRDQNAAQEMQHRSGQMGVPQTDIGGQMIVGFDKTRINALLGI
ncbi:MAG: glutaredoxin family protein [Bacteroidales bacterium]|nr:glutaredoxin family protein [Bacteroidales bacterium]MCF8402888.1 glutaredoxin family protein [Bacteroidales bacterium]